MSDNVKSRGNNESRPRGSRRGDRPDTARGRGNRGNRGGFGRGGKKFDNAQDHEESKHHRRQGKDAGNHRRGTAPRDAPKDSYFYKFHYGPWPVDDPVEVTLHSELPPQVPKDQRLREPLKEEYTKNLQHLDDEVRALFEKIKDINKEKELVFKRGVEENKAKEAAEGAHKDDGKTFKQLVEERNSNFTVKKELDAKLKGLREKLDNTIAKIKGSSKFVDPKCKTVDEVVRKIADVNNTMQTESVGAQREREMLKEISFLEKSKKHMSMLEELYPQREELKESIKAVEKDLKAYRNKINHLNEILDTKAEENKKRKEISEEKKADLQQLEDKIQAIKDQITAINSRKDEAREEFYKKKYEYECQKTHINHIELLYRRKNDLIKKEEERKRIEEEKKAEREGMVNPFEDEISTCDFLVRFCKKLLKDKEQKTVKIQKDQSRKEESAKLTEEIQKQVEEGKIAFIKNKKEREEEDVLIIGDDKLAGRKKKKDRKKNKAHKQENKAEESKDGQDSNLLTFKFEIIQSFSHIGVNPPDKIDDLESKIKEIESKRKQWFDKGERKLDEEFNKIINIGREDRPAEHHDHDEESKKSQHSKFNIEEEDAESWPAMH